MEWAPGRSAIAAFWRPTLAVRPRQLNCFLGNANGGFVWRGLSARRPSRTSFVARGVFVMESSTDCATTVCATSSRKARRRFGYKRSLPTSAVLGASQEDEQATGTGVLVNTSFNGFLSRSPAARAMRFGFFTARGLDLLVIGRFILRSSLHAGTGYRRRADTERQYWRDLWQYGSCSTSVLARSPDSLQADGRGGRPGASFARW